MKPISRVRFDAIAGYARGANAHAEGEEQTYYEHGWGRILGLVTMDRTDQDYGGLVFAPDARLRYRCVYVTPFGERRQAEIALRKAMEAAFHAPPEAHFQGDEDGEAVDFFALKRPEKAVNPNFNSLANLHGYLPARRIIEPMMRWYDDADGNFIEQFQTTGFDQRLWELYLFAAFIEIGYVLDRRHPIPDYMLESPLGEVAVEAVTVAASQGGALGDPPKTDTPQGKRDLLQQYMPIKFGSALFSKLNKRYWEKPNVTGKPLVFAIADFSSPGSMVYTRSGLISYLYGRLWDFDQDDSGSLKSTARAISEHRWNEKVIPSGFFAIPDAEHVSAILFSNSGTIAKFNRMGVIAGFCPEDVVLVRQGMMPNPEPDAIFPTPFVHVVNAPGYDELWREGLEVFHNPRAAIPLDPRTIPDARHHFMRDDGELVTNETYLDPLGSRTIILTPMTLDKVHEALAELTRRAAAQN